MNFEELLKRAGISKAELSRKLGLSKGTVSSWKASPPEYAVAYLKLLIEYNRYAP